MRLRELRDDPTLRRESASQIALIRDIFGKPFRPVAVERIWLAWEDRTVPKLARTINGDRAFDRMPILGDALEEAGCRDSTILGHCRQPVPHVRVCRVVDLLLEKA